MSDANDAALLSLEEGIARLRQSNHWQGVGKLLGGDAPHSLWERVVSLAVENDDAAREAFNVVRVALGGLPEQDPADPPPVRPDDA